MTLPVLPRADSLVSRAEVAAFVSSLVEWADEVDDVAQVKDARDRLAAITEYVRRSSNEGLAELAAAERRLEVRIGELLGPPENHGPQTVVHDQRLLDGRQRHDFRQMAAHPDVVEEVIAESTDDEPASRRRVLNAIAEKEKPVVDKTRAGVARRREQVRDMYATGHSARQIANELGIGEPGVKKIAEELGIDRTADVILGRQQRIDATRVVEHAVDSIEGVCMSLDLINPADVDFDQVEAWSKSLWRSITRLRRLLKEMNRDRILAD